MILCAKHNAPITIPDNTHLINGTIDPPSTKFIVMVA